MHAVPAGPPGRAEVDVLLDGLNDEQRRAVTTDATPLCVVAGAGSGKTRVLTRRIAYRSLTGSIEPGHVLAVTFTRKAAGELRSRLRHLGLRQEVTAGTFHALAYAQLRQRWSERGTTPPTLLDRKAGFLSRLERCDRSTAADLSGEIEWAKARVISPSAYAAAATAAGRRPPGGVDEMAAAFQRYENEKRSRGLVDFDDLLWRCVQDLERDAELAAAQRWRFRHLFVDEYQDANPLQQRLLEAWLGDRHDLCVVGDPNQAIYGWNGADPTLLTGFVDRFPGAEVVVLDRNYRSTPEILAAANAVLRSMAVAPASVQLLRRLRPTRPEGRVPVEVAHATDLDEARSVARGVVDRHGPGVPWSHQAVLCRTNAQAVLFEAAFTGFGVPCRVRGRAPFVDLPEVREALQTIERSWVPFRETLAGVEVDHSEPAVGGNEVARLANVMELLRLADEYASAERHPTGTGFRAWLATLLRGEDASGDRDAVEVVTFHVAKGLEWPVVHVTGLEDGLVPIGHARTAAELAEERRLFYVAVTRAQDELALSWARQRTFGSRTSARSRSAFLDDVEPALTAMRAGQRPADWRDHLDRERMRLRTGRSDGPGRVERAGAAAGLTSADRRLFDALDRWRSAAARAANVPAHVVLPDGTLRAIAMARPASAEELLTVAGVGPVRAARFGADVLRIVAASPSA